MCGNRRHPAKVMTGNKAQEAVQPNPSEAEIPEQQARSVASARMRLPTIRLIHSERRALLLLVDLTLLFASLIVAIDLWTDWTDEVPMLQLVTANWKWFATLGLYWLVACAIMDGYDLARAASAPHSIITVIGAAALTIVVYHFTPWLTPPLSSRGPVFFFAGQAALGLTLWRGFYAILFTQPSFRETALVLGAGAAGAALAEELGAIPSVGNPYRGTGYYVVGFVDDDPDKLMTEVAGVPILGNSADLPELAEQLGVDEIVLAITHRHTMSVAAFDALLTCREQGFRITTMPILYERLCGRIPVDHVGRDLGAVLPLESLPTMRLYRLVKRAGDILAGLVGSLALSVVALCVSVLNAAWSRGPLFYRQQRVGQGGRIFEVLKFRTMVPNAEQETGPRWSESNDPRVTPVGRWLRRTHIDELPQVLNVLRGEMSLVGPRPERPEFVEQLAERIPFYRARHAVLPGMTGWAQVRYEYGNSIQDSRVKLEYDLYYVRHAGLYLDTLIVLKTLAVVFWLQGT